MENAKPKFETPTNLEEALNVIKLMGNAIETFSSEIARLAEENLDLQSDLDDYDCENCRELEDSLEAAEERNEMLDEQVTELVKIRHAIKRGTVNDDHVYQLEKLLSELDSGWMCRA